MQLSKTRRNLITLVFMVGGFVTVLNQTVLFTALPQIMNQLHVDSVTVQWLTTGYMLLNGILIPFMAFLMEKYTIRQLVITAMGLFIVGTGMAAFANNFIVLLLARLIQSIGAGIMMPLMQFVFFSIFPREKWGSIMGLVGLIVGFAPALGPTISGIILDHFSWRYIFFLVLPVAIIVLILAIIYMENVTKVDPSVKLDMRSAVYSSVGFGLLLYGTSVIGASLVPGVAAIALGAISVASFIIRQLHMKKPMLEFRVFNSTRFTLSILLVIFSYIALMGPQTILPIYIQQIRRMSAVSSGLLLLPGAVVNGVISAIAGRVYDRIGGQKLGTAGSILILIAMIPFVMLGTATPLWLIILLVVISMGGVSMVMMPLLAEGINALDNSLVNHGTVMVNTFRQVAGSIGTALLITIQGVVTGYATTRLGIGVVNSQLLGMRSVFTGIVLFAAVGIFVGVSLKNV